MSATKQVENMARRIVELETENKGLREVARAARDLLESRLWDSGESNESWRKANALAAALARLDGPQ